MIGNVWAVFQFELRRAFTVPRMLWWGVLTAFPVFIVSMISLVLRQIEEEMPREPWFICLFAMIPMLIGMLGTFLWTAPAVSSELERQSWIYLSVRPGGRAAVLLGKYLAAVAWVLPAALISLTVCVLIAAAGTAVIRQPSEAWRLWSTIGSITLLSVPAYAAVYLLIGTIFSRRSMVVAVGYTLVFELAASKIPALVNKLTVQYRLFALLFKWSGIDFNQAEGIASRDSIVTLGLIGEGPAWGQVIILILYTVLVLIAAVLVVRAREYSVAKAAEI
jgi:ABC-type transport system involved in multi-copper enzyme maturation permease subunit